MANNFNAKEVTQNTNSNYIQHNTGLAQVIGAVGDTAAVTVTSADVDLTTGSDQTVTSNIYKALRNLYFLCSGAMTGDKNLILPTNKKFYWIEHACSGGFTLTAKTAAGTGVDLVNGDIVLVRCDGTDIKEVIRA